MGTQRIFLQGVEKLIQIGYMRGNINVNGNVERVVFSVGEDLREALQSAPQPEEGITDLMVRYVDKFKNGLIDYDTGVEVAFLLSVHPDPTLALSILSSRRPKADIITLFTLALLVFN